MRAFVKQVITALKDDDWEVNSDRIVHIKSRLRMYTRPVRFYEVPYELTWWEKRAVTQEVRKMLDRSLAAKFVLYRVAPKQPNSYGNDSF